MTTEIRGVPRSFGVAAELLVGLAWFMGTPIALFAAPMAIQVVFASRLDGLAVPNAAALLLLAAWIAISAAGTVWTVRRMDRRRARRQRRG